MAGHDDEGNPITELHFVFPNGAGNGETKGNIEKRKWHPLQVHAGISIQAVDDRGKPLWDKKHRPAMVAKYTGLHATRHFFASWCINRKVDGGLELPRKTVQSRMGHSSITLTMDTYGHLFPSTDDNSELAAAEGKHG